MSISLSEIINHPVMFMFHLHLCGHVRIQYFDWYSINVSISVDLLIVLFIIVR